MENTTLCHIEQRMIDDLGRVVIPKHMRIALGIKECDLLNLELVNGKVVISKAEEAEQE